MKRLGWWRGVGALTFASRTGVALLVAVWLTAGCGSADSDSTASRSQCVPGHESCSCRAAGARCESGLRCLSGVCVSAGSGEGGQGTGEPSGDAGVSSGDAPGQTAGAGPDGGASSSGGAGNAGSGAVSTSGGSSETQGPDTDERYALGSITLGNTHAEGKSTSSGWISAYFAPDVQGAVAGCFEEVGPCRVARPPECQGCGDEQYCAFDENCSAVCRDRCTLACPNIDDFCYFDASGEPACGPLETFEAGTLRFTGIDPERTLEHPYSFTRMGDPLFDSGSEISVSATGAERAGFGPFEQSFAATELLESAFEGLSIEQVFTSDEDVTIRWQPGRRKISLSFSVSRDGGGAAVLTCDGDDASGSFSLPRSVLNDALSGRTLTRMDVALTRTRSDWFDGFSTVGSLRNAEVQSSGWLQLATQSVETVAVVACTASGYMGCGLDCVNLREDRAHCGGCGVACAPTDFGCIEGRCSKCDQYEIECGGECVYTDDNPAHCGTCGRRCSTTAVCESGQCVECEPGQMPCDGECLDITDESNCGGCNIECDTDETCVNGQCVAPADCPNGEFDCGADGCVDLSSDPAHCGDCGDPCPGDQVCAFGECQAPRWDCDTDLRGDGFCDCGCGSRDPDCSSASSSSCDSCWCENECDDVEPQDNSQCL
jgi:hypothetical protein